MSDEMIKVQVDPAREYSRVTMMPVGLPTVNDFIGQRFDRMTIERARSAVECLRRFAEQMGDWSLEWDVDGQRTKVYYGRSGQALQDAHEIRTLINHYIRECYHTDAERDRLYI